MGEKKEDPFGLESMMNTWTKSMGDLMGGMANTGETSQMPFPFQTPLQWPFQSSEWTPFKETSRESSTTMAGMATAMKNWQTLTGAMASPQSISALFKGVGTLPEMLMNFNSSSMSGLGEIHQKIMESVARMGESAEAYKFDNMDENAFHVWADLYEKEFRKFLHIPQLGLTREYQEQFNDMTDKYNLLQAHLGEFLRLLSLPFHRSAPVMQEEIRALAEKGELSEDPKFYYQMWIKILEGHFMTLFQTPEYTAALSKTISSLSRFSQSKNKVLEDMLKSLPIASQSELDDLGQEVYQLKREIRALKKKSAQAGKK